MLNMNNNRFENMNLNNNININPMGMNNQLIPNLPLDFSEMRIKAIIESYENKITELEQIIKQKDFEITLLKEKINGFTNNQMMMNIQNNMNIMYPMMNNNNNKNNGNFVNNFNFNIANNSNNMDLNLLNNDNNILLKDWIINFNYKDKNYTEQCNKNEKLEAVYKRFCDKYGIKLTAHKLIFKSITLSKELTLAQLGISNDSKILVIENESIKSDDSEYYSYKDKECEYGCEYDGFRYNVLFKDSTGATKAISLGKENTVGELIKEYLRRLPTIELAFINSNSNSLWCSFKYSLNWRIDEKKKLKDIFGTNFMQNVIVIDTKCVMCD